MSLTNVINDLDFQIKCLEEGKPDDMWDLYDIGNWQAMLTIVEEAQKELTNYSWEKNPERMGR